MTREEQISALQARLDETNNSISQLESALAVSTDPDERRDLSARISQLQQTAETLRAMINNLSAADAPLRMTAAQPRAAGVVAAHSTAMISAAKKSSDESHKRALETINLMKVPRGIKRPPAGLGLPKRVR